MKKLKPKTMFAYAVGNLGYGTVGQTVNSFIMFFATSVLSLSGTLVGLAIALSTLWDGFSDPLVGYLSDKSSNRFFGKRVNFMFVASFGIAICNILLWIIPNNLSNGIKFAWLLITLLLLETFNTAFATPYVALGIDIAPDYNQQSALQGYKTVFFILGMIMPSVLMFVFMPSTQGIQAQFNRQGYVNISLVTSALCLLCGLVCSFGCFRVAKGASKANKKKKPNSEEKIKFDNENKFDTKFDETNTVESKLDKNNADKTKNYKKANKNRKKSKQSFAKLFSEFFYLLKNKNFGPIVVGYSVALMSSAFLISVGMHLFTYCYHFSSVQIPAIMAILFVSAIVSQPFWVFLSNRIDKKPTLNLALTTLLFGIGLTAVTFVFREFLSNSVLFGFVCPCIFVCGFGTGALYSLPVSMFADSLTLERIKTGQNKSATYSGFMTLAYNIANSVALLVIGVLLDLIKFDAAQPVQALSVQNALGIIVFGGCGLSIAFSMIIFGKYKVKRAQVLKANLQMQS